MSVKSYNERLLERRSKMTDRDVFTSPRLVESLYKTAQFMSGRYKTSKSVKVKLTWDDSDVIAFTDNKVLVINVNNPFCEGVMPNIRLILIRGLFAHEMGHVLYTDFATDHKKDEAMKSGDWYPEFPVVESPDEAANAVEIQGYLADKERNAIIRRFIHELSNILEDGYIENRILLNYKGMLGHALRTVRARHREEIPSVSEQIKMEEEGARHIYTTLCQMLLEYAKFGTVNLGDTDKDDIHIRVISSLFELVDQYLCTHDGVQRAGIVDSVFVKLWPFAKDYIRQIEETRELMKDLEDIFSGDNSIYGSSPDTNGEGSPVESEEEENSTSEKTKRSKSRRTTKKELSDDTKSSSKSSSDESGEVGSSATKSGSSSNNDESADGSPDDSTADGCNNEDKSNGKTSPVKKKNSSNSKKVGKTASGADESKTDAKTSECSDDGSEETGSAGNDASDASDDKIGSDASSSNECSDGSADDDNNELSDNSASSDRDKDTTGTPNGDIDDDGNPSDAENGDADNNDDDAISFSPDGEDKNHSDMDNADYPDDDGDPDCGDDDGELYEDEEYDSDYFDGRAAFEISEMINEMAEKAVKKEMEKETEAALNAEALSIDYGPNHKGVSIHVHRQTSVDPLQIEDYNICADPLLEISADLQRSVRREIQDRQTGGRLDGLYFGKRFDSRKTYRNDGRYFYKKNLPQEIPDLAIGVLVDESGSMRSGNRDIYARATSIILYDFCKGLDIPVCIYGHSTERGYSRKEDVSIYSYVEFDSPDEEDAYRLMKIQAKANNRDAMALRFVAEHLMKRPEEEKMLIIISDGQPMADGYYGPSTCEELTNLADEYVRMGIKFVAAAIGDDKPQIQKIYGDAFLNISNLDDLPDLLTRIIKEQLPVIS